MSDEDFETDHGRRGGRGGAAAPEQGIPRWQSHPPPGLRQYLEHQRASMGQGAVPQQPPADAPAAVVDGMEQALDAMERALEEQNSWKSSILPRGHLVEGFLTRHGLLAKLKVLCHTQGFKVGCYFGGHDTSFGVKALRIQCTCGRPQKKSDREDRHFNSRHSCLGCKWFRTVIPVERGPDTPVVFNAATGLSNRVYPTCKWMVSNHGGSTHCEDHTGHCKVPHNHLAGIDTQEVQTIINDHGLLDSITSLLDRIQRLTGQYFSWRRLRHMVRKKHDTDHLGAAGPRPPRAGKSQELMDWLVKQETEGALKYLTLTLDFEAMDAPAPEPPEPQPPPHPNTPLQEEAPSIFTRIMNWWNRPAQPPATPPAPEIVDDGPAVDARGRKKRTQKK